MYYDQYSQYIYQYLTNNDFAGKLQTIITKLNAIGAAVDQIVPYVAFILFFYIGFNMIRKRWLNV